MGGGDFASQMAAMQQQMMQNPEMVRQMMESPLMQGMMNNPEMLRNIFTSNPQMQQLLEVCVCSEATQLSTTQDLVIHC